MLLIARIKSESIKKNQFKLCSKYDREHDLDVKFGQAGVDMWKHSNKITWQVETPGTWVKVLLLRNQILINSDLIFLAEDWLKQWENRFKTIDTDWDHVEKSDLFVK